jgi:hypothetical protein
MKNRTWVDEILHFHSALFWILVKLHMMEGALFTTLEFLDAPIPFVIFPAYHSSIRTNGERRRSLSMLSGESLFSANIFDGKASSLLGSRFPHPASSCGMRAFGGRFVRCMQHKCIYNHGIDSTIPFLISFDIF